ncbi:hypothetical protein SAMN02745751_02668 [Dethiosulfatibacter aminovorans DSM 17477]|uniref:ThiS family protein n=1 Tax=Dethiosulfatibacter aminovorans DSM 17477 TaxID=1121476 RepID=A0A1M6JN67_9FIRM|nr:MoaD/ThiS family protein [Dethiosulfatibacter aminovorans]SHJ48171.1 hypothetical protein SAMN02745751_02668 [Dethiosulfatibacter aminovorans DSM 17477]
MYSVNNVNYKVENNISLKSIVNRYENSTITSQIKGFANYIILNKKKIKRNELDDIIIKDGDVIVIIPFVGAG